MTRRPCSVVFGLGLAASLAGCVGNVDGGPGAAPASGEDGGGGSSPASSSTAGAGGSSGLVELAGGLPSPAGIALDAARVYWTNTGASLADGSVMAVPKGGGARVGLASARRSPSGIAVADGAVLWTETAPSEDSGGALLRLDLAEASSIEVLAGALTGPGALVVFGSRAYVAASPLLSIPVRGGAPTLFGDVWRTAVTGLAADADAVYGPGEIVRSPIDGSRPKMLAPSLVADGLARDGAFIYATVGSVYAVERTQLVRIPVAGGAPEILASELANAGGVLVDGELVYWTERGSSAADMRDGCVKRAPKGGGPATTIAARQHGPVALAVDGDAIYWTNAGDAGAADGSVMKAPK